MKKKTKKKILTYLVLIIVAGFIYIFQINDNKVVLEDLNGCYNQNQQWEMKINYSDLDNYNRVGKVRACLSKDNLGASKTRTRQYFNPTGWNNQIKTIKGKRVTPQNRGHLIAYTYSFNFDDKGNYQPGAKGSIDNPLNLATQTEYTNQVLYQKYENIVRDALKNNKNIYLEIQPVFNSTELMARSFKFKALSEDGSINIDVDIPNIHPLLTFDYATGRSSIIKNN